MSFKKMLNQRIQDIEQLSNKYSIKTFDYNLWLEKLTGHYQALCLVNYQNKRTLIEGEIIAIEKSKLKIIDAIVHYLSQDQFNIESKKKVKPSKIETFFSYPYALFGSVLAGIAGYLGIRTLFNFFHLLNPITLGLSIGTGILQAGLFVINDVRSLKKSVGVNIFGVKQLMKLYKKQLNQIKKIPFFLMSEPCLSNLSVSEYKKYHDLINHFTHDLKEKNIVLKATYEETRSRKIFKRVVSTVDGILCTSTGFFLGKCILGLLAAPLVSTPIGLAICGAIALFSLGTFLFLRRSNIFNAIDKLMGEPKKLIREQNEILHDKSHLSTLGNKIESIISHKNQEIAKRNKLEEKVKLLEQKVTQLNFAIKNNSQFIDHEQNIKYSKDRPKNVNTMSNHRKIPKLRYSNIFGSTNKIRHGLFSHNTKGSLGNFTARTVNDKNRTINYTRRVGT